MSLLGLFGNPIDDPHYYGFDPHEDPIDVGPEPVYCPRCGVLIDDVTDGLIEGWLRLHLEAHDRRDRQAGEVA